MTLRNAIILGMVAAVCSLIGAEVGYRIAKQENAKVINTSLASDFNQRLTSLRAMREHKLPSQTVESFELSAVSVLDHIDLDAPKEDAAHVVLTKAGEVLALYLRDFPNSQFADRRHSKVALLTAMAQR
jgi:hypothetical protein